MYNAHREKRTLPGLSDDVSGFISVTWTRHTRQYRSIDAHLRTPNTKERFHAGFRNTNRIPFRPKHNRVEFINYTTISLSGYTHYRTRGTRERFRNLSRDDSPILRPTTPKSKEGIGPSQSLYARTRRIQSIELRARRDPRKRRVRRELFSSLSFSVGFLPGLRID